MSRATGSAAPTEIELNGGRWTEAEPLPASDGRLLRYRLLSSGAPIAIQLIRKAQDGTRVAWLSIHSGPLSRKQGTVDTAELIAVEGAEPSPDDLLIVRLKALNDPATVKIDELRLAASDVEKEPAKPGAMGPEGLRWPDPGTGDARRKVLMFGTFDVENYGDLLFPLVAERRLAAAGLEVLPVSPTDATTRFDDARRPMSIDQVAQLNPPGCGVLIGGGNVVHLRPTPLEDYKDARLEQLAYPALWVGATVLAAAYRMPVAWNAPGVPCALSGWPEADLGAAAAAAADYLSVRDEASREAFGQSAAEAAIVPDTAVEISRIWPLRDLQPVAAEVFGQREVDASRGYIAVHVKARSLQGTLEELASALDSLAADSQRAVALLAIGPCHGDDETARRLGQMMSARTAVFDTPSSLREIAAVIACADLLLSSSLHGYITSFSYGRPGLLVGAPAHLKFQGFTKLVGRGDDLVPDWASALAAARERLSQPQQRQDLLSGEISRRLDEHWQAVIRALSAAEPKSAARSDFLRSVTAVNLYRGGFAAALAGLVQPQ